MEVHMEVLHLDKVELAGRIFEEIDALKLEPSREKQLTRLVAMAVLPGDKRKPIGCRDAIARTIAELRKGDLGNDRAAAWYKKQMQSSLAGLAGRVPVSQATIARRMTVSTSAQSSRGRSSRTPSQPRWPTYGGRK